MVAFAEGLESLNWSGNSRGSVLEKALLFSDENILGRTEFKHWIELMVLLPENDAISELTELSNAFLACTDQQRSAILTQLTKAPRERVELAAIMSNAITAYPFHGQTEEFDLQSNNFFSTMSGWTESYAEGYAAMLVLFGEKNELRMAEIERIDLQFEEAKRGRELMHVIRCAARKLAIISPSTGTWKQGNHLIFRRVRERETERWMRLFYGQITRVACFDFVSVPRIQCDLNFSTTVCDVFKKWQVWS